MQSLQYAPRMGDLIGTLAVIKPKDDGWLTTALYPTVKNLIVVKKHLQLLIGLNWKSKDHFAHGLNQCTEDGSRQSFDKIAVHATAKAEFLRRIKNISICLTCFNDASWLDAFDGFISEVERGRLHMKPIDWLHFLFHEAMAQLQRTLSRRILVAGVEVPIKTPQDAVDICKALLAGIDATHEREVEYRTFHALDVIETDASPAATVGKSISTAVEKSNSDDTPDTNEVMTESKRRRKRAKAAADRIKAGTATTSTGVAAVAVPSATSHVQVPHSVGSSVPKHICVSYLAESSGVCAGVTCTYGSACAFKHVAAAGANKREALNAIERGSSKKMSKEQAAALKAYVEANCT